MTPIQIEVTLLIGLVLVLLTYAIRNSGDAALKRKRFRVYIKLLIKKIEGTLTRDFAIDSAGVFRDIKQLETNVLDVTPHISRSKLGRFNDAFAAYKAVRFGPIGTPESNAEAEKAKAKLITLLGEISRLAT
jgi:hypothetical protein